MSIRYIPYGSTKIVVGGETYQNKDGKSAVIPVENFSKEELDRLLKRKLIRKLELDESGTPVGKKKPGLDEADLPADKKKASQRKQTSKDDPKDEESAERNRDEP